MNYVWFMGVWKLGSFGREHDLRKDFNQVLPGYKADDVIGSPYAIANYSCNPEIGSDAMLLKLKQHLNSQGVKLMLDFVPNHVAVDHPWACDHPEYLLPVHRDYRNDPNSCIEDHGFTITPPCQQQKDHRQFYYGGDYWNGGWTDTLQVNYWNPELREAQTQNLLHIASMSDSVRVDMAMSVLNRHIELSWAKDRRHGSCSTGKRGAMSDQYKHNPPQEEFWTMAINRVREAHPGFVFTAEAYNYGFTQPAEDMVLRNLGFDYTYDISALKFLENNNHHDFKRYAIGQGVQYFNKAIHFVENHDDNRAAGHVLHSNARAIAGAVLTSFLPGANLFFHGQFHCLKNKLGVHLRRSGDEYYNTGCSDFFSKMLTLIQDSVVQDGTWMGVQGCYHSTERGAFATNADILIYKWRQGNNIRMVVANWKEQSSSGYVLLEELKENESCPNNMCNVHERYGDKVHNLPLVSLRDAGFHLQLKAWEVQVYDYSV